VRIRGWLTGLIVFLLAPSLLFASLWFYNKFENVNAIDRSLTGLKLIQALGPLMQEKALTGSIQKSPENLKEHLINFAGENRSAGLLQDLRTFLGDPETPLSLRKARSLSMSLSQLAQLESSVSYEASRLPNLINDTLPSVVIESSIMVINAKRLSVREKINTWDKMLIPVQGGQFKVAADAAIRKTSSYLSVLTGEKADTLRENAENYRKSNYAYQTEGAKLLSSTIKGASGKDIIAEPVIEVQPELVRASFLLWQSAVDYLSQDLQKRRAETLFAVSLAGIVGGLVIIVAFVIGVALTRALADRTQQEFENLGFHDPLTGLPNRRALLKAIRTVSPTDNVSQTGLILIDLRHFKKVNDRFGDHNGDSILRSVAEQLIQHAEPEDFIGRTGGTEFMLLRPRLENANRFEQLATAIISDLGKERNVEGHKTSIEANAGLLVSQPGDDVTDQILVDAALALRSAKQQGPGKLELFTSGMRANFVKNGETAKQLLRALRKGGITPWFQPQIDLHTGKVVGAEALVRWIENDKIRYPGSFLPAATEAGYMDQIDATVRDKTLQLAAQLNGSTNQHIHFGLNVSSDLLSDPDAVEALHRQVQDMGLEPTVISVEILEAVMIDEHAATPIKENIARLSELGFFIELDDFGTGHSSISSLRDLKIDRVKIDRSFISGVDQDPGLQKFTSALINLAKSLDISVLAEGVETEGERLWLQQNGCDVIQGFLISKAVPEDQLSTMILQRNFSAHHEDTYPMEQHRNNAHAVR
jgi:diguanylate cyclase (GGDEF)-like protein